jgi:solute:Na+ symporter, SSS family
MARTASDYFIAGRKLSLWIFVLAATATSYSGWTFMGHPGLVYRDGFQYAFASFYAVVIPLTGILFLKRQWMLGKRFGYITPGEMMADYFQGDAIRILTVLVALFYSIPYLGVQLAASGYLFNVITDGIVDVAYGAVILSIVVLLYVASGGLRAVAYVDTVQCILLWLGIVIVGMIAISFVGGWDALIIAMSRLGASSIGQYGTTQNVAGSGGDFNAYFAVPGVIQFTAGLGKEAPIGGVWTAVMILTYMFALMGIQAAPAFTMWAFSNTNPAPFAPQAVWASAMWIGGTLIFFTTFQGMAAHFLGANPLVTEAGLAVDPTVLPVAIAADPDTLVPYYFNLIADIAPWLVGLLAVCALAAMQ